MVEFESSRQGGAGIEPEQVAKDIAQQPEMNELSHLLAPETTLRSETLNIESRGSGEDLFASNFVPHESVATLTDWQQLHEMISHREEYHLENNTERQRPPELERLTNWKELENLISSRQKLFSATERQAEQASLTELQSESLHGLPTGQSDQLISPELMISRPLLDTELLQRDTHELHSLYESYRSEIVPMVIEMREQLTRIGISGRGELDLARTLEEKRGTYNNGRSGGGYIMVWGLGRSESSPAEQLVNNLEEMGIRAINYTTLTNRERMKTDPNPGGILVLETSYNLPIRNAQQNALEREEKNIMGEATIDLQPDNFDSQVRGVIPFKAFQNLVNERERLANTLEQFGFGKPEANPEQYNAAYERLEIVKRIAALLVATKALELVRNNHQPDR